MDFVHLELTIHVSSSHMSNNFRQNAEFELRTSAHLLQLSQIKFC